MIYIGIDPGASGGIAFIETMDQVVGATKTPATERDVWQWIASLSGSCRRGNGGRAIIEKVGGYVGEAQPGSAAFKFGASYGGLRMALIAAGIPFDEVTPQTWQREFALKRAKDETKTAWKNRLKAKAQQLFPQETVTLATADALLIAEYCRRKHTKGGA